MTRRFDVTGVHQISIDEADTAQSKDIAYKAFCTCDWSAEVWRHSTDYVITTIEVMGAFDAEIELEDPAQGAYDAACADGDQHMQEVQV